MLFKKNESNVFEDNELKIKMKKSKFVFSYGYGILSSQIKDYTQLVVLDNEIIVKKTFTNDEKNIYKSLKKDEQCKQVREYFLQKGVLNQLEIMNNIPPKELKIYKNSRIDIVYLKVNGKTYSFDGNSANMEYRKFLQKIIKKVYAFLNINYLYNNNQYRVSLKAPANWIELNTDYGHPIFKFVPINISKGQVLFKFSGIVTFSPALYGQYTVEKIGEGTEEEFKKSFDNFIKFISAEENNYKLIKQEKIELKDRIVYRSFIRYTNSNITSIVDYVFLNNHILAIGCPLCLNMTDEETLNSKNIELNNHIIDTIKMYNKVNINEKEKMIEEDDIKVNDINIVNKLSEITEDYINNKGKKLISSFAHSIIPKSKDGYIFWTKTSEDVLCYLIMHNLEKNNKVNLELLMNNLEDFEVFKYICKNANYNETNMEYANIVNILKKSADIQLQSYYEILLVSLKLIPLCYEELTNKIETIKKNNYFSISTWFGKNEIGIETKIVDLNDGYYYEISTRKGNATEKYENIHRIDLIKAPLVLEFKECIMGNNIFKNQYSNNLILDRGTTVEVFLNNEKKSIKNEEELYAKMKKELELLLEKNKMNQSKLNDNKNKNLSDDLINLICEKLNISKDEAMQNCKELTGMNAYYFWNSSKGGISVIIKPNGERLFATSGVSFLKHLEEFNKGKRN